MTYDVYIPTHYVFLLCLYNQTILDTKLQYYGHPPSTYELISDNQGPSCPTGREITESSECKEAADGLGLDYNDVFTVDSFSHTPCGCFLWDAGTDGVVDKLAFNEGDTCTTTSRALGMICKTEVSQIPPPPLQYILFI